MLISKQTPKEEVLKISEKTKQNFEHCKFSSGYVLEEEIKEIAEFLKLDEQELREKCLDSTERFGKKIFRIKQDKKTLKLDKEEVELPHGKCIFYDERFGCLLNEKRPLFCKLSNHPLLAKDLIEWFDLNFIIDSEDPTTLREWQVYLDINKDVIPGGKLEEVVPKEKLNKIINNKIISKSQLKIERLKEEANKILRGDWNEHSHR